VTLPIAHLSRVAVEGGPATQLPMPEAGSGDYSPDGNRMVYSPAVRDFRSENVTAAAWRNKLYILNLNYDAKQITEARGPRAIRCGSAIRSISILIAMGTSNLYSYNVSSARTNQVTRSKLWTFAGPVSDHDAASSMKWMVNCRSWIQKR